MKDLNKGARFSKYRFAMLLMAGIYPVITGGLYLLHAFTGDWPLWQRTLVIVPAMVSLMVWIINPLIQRRFAGFLHPETDPARNQ